MRLKRSQVVTAGAAALATVGILGGTLAYFTDYDSKDLSAKAGTLKMEIADATTSLSVMMELWESFGATLRRKALL